MTNPSDTPPAPAPTRTPAPLPLEYLFDHAGARADEVARACQLSESDAHSMLTLLVRDGILSQHDGSYYPRPAVIL